MIRYNFKKGLTFLEFFLVNLFKICYIEYVSVIHLVDNACTMSSVMPFWLTSFFIFISNNRDEHNYYNKQILYFFVHLHPPTFVKPPELNSSSLYYL